MHWWTCRAHRGRARPWSTRARLDRISGLGHPADPVLWRRSGCADPLCIDVLFRGVMIVIDQHTKGLNTMRETAFNSENIEHSGVTVRIDYFYDTDHDAPWKEYDGCGVIREVSSYYGRPEKSPGEVIMHSDRGYYWLYDVQATTEKAKREGWGLGAEEREKLVAKLGRVPTSGEVTAEAVNRDLAFCRGYLRDDWFYVGVVCTVLDQDGEETEDSDS